MNTLTLTAAQSAHVAVNLRAVLVVAYCVGVFLLVLWLRSRYLSRRFARTFTRSLTGSASRPRLSARGTRKAMARSGRSRRASRSFRKAVLISVLLAAAWLFVQLHTHTH